MAPRTAKTSTDATTRITRLQLKTTPPIISKAGQNTKKQPAYPMYADTASKIEDAGEATTIRVANRDTKAGAPAAIVDMEAMPGSEEQMCDTNQFPEAEQEVEQEATPPLPPPLSPPPKRKIKIRSNIKSTTTITKVAITSPTTKQTTKPTTTLSPKSTRLTQKTRTRSSPPRTSGQGNIIKTSRPAANDVFLYGKRLNLLYDDAFQQMKDFWEDFGGCVDASGRFLE